MQYGLTTPNASLIETHVNYFNSAGWFHYFLLYEPYSVAYQDKAEMPLFENFQCSFSRVKCHFICLKLVLTLQCGDRRQNLRSVNTENCGTPESEFPSFQVPKIPELEVPKFRSSQVLKFRSSQVPGTSSSQVPKFPELQVPKFRSSRNFKFRSSRNFKFSS